MDQFSTYHPAINFFYFAGVILMAMFFNHPVMMAEALFAAVLYSFFTLGTEKALRFNLLAMVPILLIAVLFNPMFNHYGVHILGYFPNGNPITLESIIYGFVMGVMLVTVIIWFSSYNKVMTSDKFVYLFGRMIPALSLILSMVLRFVPRFKKQLEVISNGQKCIGRDVSSGNLIDRAKHGVRIISIMITWALENAIETADSMRARGYGLKGRTAFSIFRFDNRDAIAAILMGLAFVITCIGLAMGAGAVQYNPYFKAAGINPVTPLSLLTFICYFLFCLSPVIIDIMGDYRWRRLRNSQETGISMTGADESLRNAMFGTPTSDENNITDAERMSKGKIKLWT